MSQSSVIAGAIVLAFLFYLAANNRLQAYTNVVWGPTARSVPQPSTSSSSSSSSGGGMFGQLGSLFNLGGSSSGSGKSGSNVVQDATTAAEIASFF